jgi:transcriptional regulator with XRE-family HTH domain
MARDYTFENMPFLAWLDERLQEKGWKDAELARRGNFSATTLTNVRTGVRRPGFKLINGVAIALGVDSEEVASKAGRLGDGDGQSSESDEEAKLLKKIRRAFSRMEPGTQETFVAIGETMAARDERNREKKPSRNRSAKAHS